MQAADPDLMGWWSMDTEVDGMVLDSSGNGRHGTLNGAPAFVAGVNDGAIELFGGPDFISIEGYQGIDGTNPFSIAAWVKTTNTDIQQIMHWGTDSGGQRVEFRINSSRLRISHGNGNVQGNTTIPDGEWHHVVAAVVENASASSGDVTFYVNGVDDTHDKSDPDTWTIVASLPLTIRRMFSATVSTSSKMCEEMRIVRPSSASRRMSCWNSRRWRGSVPLSGSSSRSSSGSCTNAPASLMRWRMPRE